MTKTGGFAFLFLCLFAASANAVSPEEASRAEKHAISLLKEAGKDLEEYSVSLSWMDEEARMATSNCKERHENGLDTEGQMHTCLERHRTAPDYWKADFAKKAKTIPREHCIFTFDNQLEPVKLLATGCGYNK